MFQGGQSFQGVTTEALMSASKFASDFRKFDPVVQKLIASLTPTQFAVFEYMYKSKRRDWLVALLLSVLFGYLGFDRFYLRDIQFGLAKLLLSFLVVGFVLWIVDVFLVPFALPKANEKVALDLVNTVKATVGDNVDFTNIGLPAVNKPSLIGSILSLVKSSPLLIVLFAVAFVLVVLLVILLVK